MRILPDFSPVRHNRAFGRLLVGGLLSTLGSAMTSFAVVLQIWDLSRSSLAVGLLGLTFVPVLIVGLFGGSIADAVDRRKLALVTSAGLMAVSAAFAVQAYRPHRSDRDRLPGLHRLPGQAGRGPRAGFGGQLTVTILRRGCPNGPRRCHGSAGHR